MKLPKSLAIVFLAAASFAAGVQGASAQDRAHDPSRAAFETATTPGVQTIFSTPTKEYPNAKTGFSEVHLTSGKAVGYKFHMDGKKIKGYSTYNLDDPFGAASFQSAINNAQRTSSGAKPEPLQF